jgi:outer membrane protein OmpA-like peptidoglycan-associated protein
MKSTGLMLLILGFASLMPAQQPAGEQAPAPATPPSSMKGSVREELPPQPPPLKVAQTNLVEKATAPTYHDLYCGGFITNQSISEKMYVAAGWDTPHQTKFSDREYIYLTGGGFQEGATYYIVRKLKDPNRYEDFKGQTRAINAVGQPYADIGHVSIVRGGGVRGETAIAVVDFTCEPIVPGDVAIPFVERTQPEFRPTPFDPYVPPNGKLIARIVMGRDFDQFIGTGRAVYLNVGAQKGVKVGDYFHAFRTYPQTNEDQVDRISYQATTTEDTQKKPPTFAKGRLGELPRRVLGDMVVLNVTPTSATAMVTFALQDIMVGDGVEMFEPPPLPPPPAPVADMPPTINCTASPASVHSGEISTITCQAASPDNHPVQLAFATSSGKVTPRENTAVLDTASLAPGSVTVTGTATDDRNLTASSPATVTVEAAAAAPGPTSQQITFNRRSARVDNKAKAILDGVALQLQQQADSTAVVVGHSDQGERKSLAMQRAANVKTYLTQGKGIDPKRIETRAGVAPGTMAEVWVVPAGTTIPAETAPSETTPPAAQPETTPQSQTTPAAPQPETAPQSQTTPAAPQPETAAPAQTTPPPQTPPPPQQ